MKTKPYSLLVLFFLLVSSAVEAQKPASIENKTEKQTRALRGGGSTGGGSGTSELWAAFAGRLVIILEARKAEVDGLDADSLRKLIKDTPVFELKTSSPLPKGWRAERFRYAGGKLEWFDVTLTTPQWREAEGIYNAEKKEIVFVKDQFQQLTGIQKALLVAKEYRRAVKTEKKLAMRSLLVQAYNKHPWSAKNAASLKKTPNKGKTNSSYVTLSLQCFAVNDEPNRSKYVILNFECVPSGIVHLKELDVRVGRSGWKDYHLCVEQRKAIDSLLEKSDHRIYKTADLKVCDSNGTMWHTHLTSKGFGGGVVQFEKTYESVKACLKTANKQNKATLGGVNTTKIQPLVKAQTAQPSKPVDRSIREVLPRKDNSRYQGQRVLRIGKNRVYTHYSEFTEGREYTVALAPGQCDSYEILKERLRLEFDEKTLKKLGSGPEETTKKVRLVKWKVDVGSVLPAPFFGLVGAEKYILRLYSAATGKTIAVEVKNRQFEEYSKLFYSVKAEMKKKGMNTDYPLRMRWERLSDEDSKREPTVLRGFNIGYGGTIAWKRISEDEWKVLRAFKLPAHTKDWRTDSKMTNYASSRIYFGFDENLKRWLYTIPTSKLELYPGTVVPSSYLGYSDDKFRRMLDGNYRWRSVPKSTPLYLRDATFAYVFNESKRVWDKFEWKEFAKSKAREEMNIMTIKQMYHRPRRTLDLRHDHWHHHHGRRRTGR